MCTHPATTAAKTGTSDQDSQPPSIHTTSSCLPLPQAPSASNKPFPHHHHLTYSSPPYPAIIAVFIVMARLILLSPPVIQTLQTRHNHIPSPSEEDKKNTWITASGSHTLSLHLSRNTIIQHPPPPSCTPFYWHTLKPQLLRPVRPCKRVTTPSLHIAQRAGGQNTSEYYYLHIQTSTIHTLLLNHGPVPSSYASNRQVLWTVHQAKSPAS